MQTVLSFSNQKVSESESCSVMPDCDSLGQNIGVGSLSLFQGIFPIQGSNPCLLALQEDSLPDEPQAKPKNTGVGSLSLLQGMLLTQESNRGLLHCRRIFYQLSYQGSPLNQETSQRASVLKVWLDIQILFRSVQFSSVAQSCQTPIPKKGNAKECSNCCTIALISHASKVMLKVLQARLQQHMNRELPDVQAGIRKGRGTRDQIANIHWITEKGREFQKNIYFCFIDYAKAFDYVDQNKLWKRCINFLLLQKKTPNQKSIPKLSGLKQQQCLISSSFFLFNICLLPLEPASHLPPHPTPLKSGALRLIISHDLGVGSPGSSAVLTWVPLWGCPQSSDGSCRAHDCLGCQKGANRSYKTFYDQVSGAYTV